MWVDHLGLLFEVAPLPPVPTPELLSFLGVNNIGDIGTNFLTKVFREVTLIKFQPFKVIPSLAALEEVQSQDVCPHSEAGKD